MEFSVKYKVVGKPEMTGGKKYAAQGHRLKKGQILASFFSEGWQPKNLSRLEVITHACQKGFPIAVGVYRDGHRSDANFIKSGVVVVDVDAAAGPGAAGG
jgi:hypothetical protein